MHIDARKLETNSLIEGDICIVGAGAAGISLALEWINTPYRVILLEGGGFEYDEQVQDLYAGKTSGQRYYPLKSSRLHYFGGTTGHWAGMCAPFDPIDFQKREWVAHSGWPIQLEDLRPYYQRAQPLVDLGADEYSLGYWQRKYPSWVPLPLDEKVIWNKMWQFSPPTRFGAKYKKQVVNARNVILYTYANVTDIVANAEVSAVRQVTIQNHAPRKHTVKAKVFVLACCSIQNARLLLASNKQAPKGLGNDHDLVGRYFMEHLEIKSSELFLKDPNPLPLYEWGKAPARAELALTASKQAEHKILNGTVSLTPLAIARKLKPMIDVWTAEDPRKNWDSLYSNFDMPALEGQTVKDVTWDRAYELFTRIEQAPNPDSRITLDRELDSLGVPRAHLHWVLTPFEKRSLRKIHEVIGQQAGLAGIGRVRLMDFLKDPNDESWPEFAGAGWHHMGTTRMSNDPSTGVVDPNCKVHSLSNLFVAGASCYVTAAAPNPTLTLIALTLRLSDHLKQWTADKR